MSRIQQLPGAVDFLQRGLVAGQKLRALETELQQNQIRSALLMGELEHQDMQQSLTDALVQARTEQLKTSSDLDKVQADRLGALLPLQMADIQSQVRERGAAGARATQRLASDLSDARTRRTESGARTERLEAGTRQIDAQTRALQHQQAKQAERDIIDVLRSAGDPVPNENEAREFVKQGFEAQGIKVTDDDPRVGFMTQMLMNRSEQLAQANETARVQA